MSRLLADEELRIRFAIDRIATLAALHDCGLPVAPHEIDLFVESDAQIWFGDQTTHTFSPGLNCLSSDTASWYAIGDFTVNVKVAEPAATSSPLHWNVVPFEGSDCAASINGMASYRRRLMRRGAVDHSCLPCSTVSTSTLRD
jgi:hypothetical protein